MTQPKLLDRVTARPESTTGNTKQPGISEITEALKPLLADTLALWMKTKNFHWHVSGPNFRQHHLLLDEQADQIYAMVDPLAERARKLGGTTLHSIAEIGRRQRIADDDSENVPAEQMLGELARDNRTFVQALKDVHAICERHEDMATTSLIEVWVDETERRIWFLRETLGRKA